jgi:aldehyde dehydrogenase (NAD+)
MCLNVDEAKTIVFEKCGISDLNSGVYYSEWGPTENRKKINITSPINGKPIAKVTLATLDDYAKTIKAAKEAFEVWRRVPAPKRGEVVRAISDELIAYKESLGLLVSIEVGKTLSEGQGEVQEMIDIGNFCTGLSRQLYGVTIASERPEHRLYEQWHPLGVIGVITAFNFPIAVWSWNSLIAAIIGNVTLWKPSSKAPLTAIAVTKIANKVLEERGYPPIFYLLVGPGLTIGKAISQDTNIPLVSFTGSVKAGRDAAMEVSKRLGKSLLELGGNNGSIISNKADLKVAIKGVAFGVLATAGQRCTTTRRAIVQEDVYDEFLSKMKSVFKEAPIGNPLDPKTLIGPLIDPISITNYHKAIKIAQEQGGLLATGGKELEIKGCEGGYYVEPVIIEATPDMPIVKEETFAPLLYVMKYKTLEEAVKIHNSVPQGLSSAIFTTDLREEEYFLSNFGSDCGLANVNTSTAGAEIGGAFGGEKDTGGGRESGSDAWKIYARRQTVTINYGKDVPLSQGVKFNV